jgi:diguanylate cyclase (GGDEF)-like protein
VEQSIDALIKSKDASFAVAFLDVDAFKHVNDFYGHAVGDQLLIEMSRRISMALRPSDMVARLGGDEFLVMLSPVSNSDAVSKTFAEMLERISRPYFIDNNEILSTASVGVSQYPHDGMSYSALQSNADRAMYRSKSTGRGLIQFFDETIEHSVIEQTKLEHRLRLAIRDRRISCAYQPKVDLHNGDVYGIEVLMRWIDEDGKIQPPGEFIGLAVELGLLDDLTFLLLEKTIDAIDRINEAFGYRVSISINVAAKQAGDIVFMRALLAMVSATGFASRFILEITEEAFVSKSLFQDSVLPLIREVGARVSIDDFGVGYSSLSALADITADEVKIDRSFITNVHQRPRSQNVLKAIEALSYSLGMDVVVEGIETIEELMYLRTFTGIKNAQGYYFSKPILLEDIVAGHQAGSRKASSPRSCARSR